MAHTMGLIQMASGYRRIINPNILILKGSGVIKYIPFDINLQNVEKCTLI